MRQLVCTAPLPVAAGLRLQQQPLAAVPRRRSRPLPRLASASLAGSSEDTEKQQQQQQQPLAAPPAPSKPSIKQTMADLDALLGIEEKPEEPAQVRAPVHGGWLVGPCLRPSCYQPRPSHGAENLLHGVLLQEAKPAAAEDAAKITISADVLKQLAEAEAARAEKMGSAVSSSELQTRIADSIERIVEQVGVPAAPRSAQAPPPCSALRRACGARLAAATKRRARRSPRPLLPAGAKPSWDIRQGQGNARLSRRRRPCLPRRLAGEEAVRGRGQGRQQDSGGGGGSQGAGQPVLGAGGLGQRR